MSIRKSNKDHLREKAPALVAVGVVQSHHSEYENELTFYTRHETKPRFVSLVQFRDGQADPQNGRGRKWNGAFSGRPGLLNELAPALRNRLMFATATTAAKWERSMRAWWRLFDRLESGADGVRVGRLDSVTQLTELHAAAALEDESIDRGVFCAFRAVASETRVTMGLPPLLWPAPEVPKPFRSLPAPAGIARYWNALKHGWFHALDRWRLAQSLLLGELGPEKGTREWQLLKAASHFKLVETTLPPHRGLPTNAILRDSYAGQRLLDKVELADMWDAFFPSARDIRMAFHMCLAGTGWNPQTLLDLPVDHSSGTQTRTPFIRKHPGDEAKYILTGFKERGASEHDVHGDWRIDRSPGRVIYELVQRTWPLREFLLQELHQARSQLETARDSGAAPGDVARLWTSITDLTRRSSSAWLYVHKGEVQVLSDLNYRGDTSARFLDTVAQEINSRLPAESQVPTIKASDFRDAFAAYVWKVSGGSVWHVRRALGQRNITTSTIYLDNTAVNEESARVWTTFVTVIWNEFRAKHALDLTVIAKLSRDGEITERERTRLEEYRDLKRSRIGVGCRDPYNPPPEIDPNFEPDGESQCTVHRCTLCLSHGVITLESFDGLCMRQAELEDLQSIMPFGEFTLGEYDKELANTRTALLGFDPAEVQVRLSEWKTRIDSGEHRYPQFDGVQTA